MATTTYRLSELDEAELRWFWNHADGDLGFRSTSGADFERASQAPLCDSRPCDVCRGPFTRLEIGRRELRATRREQTARCRECNGLGVIVDVVRPRPSLAGGGMPREAPQQTEGASMRVRRFLGGKDQDVLVRPRAALRYVRGLLVQLHEREVRVLHAVHGPPPMDSAIERAIERAPAVAIALVLLNRAVDESLLRRALGEKRVRALRTSVSLGPRRHADMLLSAASRAYDRARRSFVDEDREQAVEDLAAMERLWGAA